MPASEYPAGSDLRQSDAYDAVITVTLPMERPGRSHGPNHVREAGCDDAISDGSKEQEVAPPCIQVPSRCSQRQTGMRQEQGEGALLNQVHGAGSMHNRVRTPSLSGLRDLPVSGQDYRLENAPHTFRTANVR